MLASSGQSCWREGSQAFTRPSWLQVTLADFETKMQSLFLNSAENDDNADSFAERAENYYRKRPQLLAFLSDLYHRYLSLADRYCLLKQQSQISTVQLDDEDDYDRQINNYPNPDSDAESTLSYQPPHAENLGGETLPRRKKQPEFDATGIRLVGKTADEIIETYTRKNLRDVNMRQLAELAGNNSREPAYGNDGSGKLVPETQSRCQEIRSGRDLQDGLVEKSAVQRCEASSGNQSYRNIRRVVEETTVDTEGTLSPRKIGQESEIIVRQRVENNCRETDVEQKLPGSKKRAENHPEIPSESDFRTRLAGAVSGTDQNSCWKLTVVKNQNQSRKIRPESDAKYRHVAKPGRKRCWEVVVSGQKRRETMPETERLVGEIVAKTVDCEVLVNEVGVLQQCQTELFRKIDLQRSLLEVLESERLILLSENGRLGFRITAMAEENKGLVSEIVFLKRKANEMARWVVKMREEERVCMVSRKIENLQGQICRLEKNNREYYEKLVRREEKGEGRSPMDRVKAENVRLQDLMRVNKGRDGVGRFLDRVKVLLCGFVDSAR